MARSKIIEGAIIFLLLKFSMCHNEVCKHSDSSLKPLGRKDVNVCVN